MPKEFTGYLISRGWKKLTLFHFNAKTHARMGITEIVPTANDKAARAVIVRNKLTAFGLPTPPPCFDPK